ncbi:hypothetical protein AC792_00550 [Arthrobacter sp. RIT-PI-e]|uniref:hypothetical protein n=1 Tax=Arthrobacter sp. RIT-PI-e TaxID=1681197 RepID=UPI0006764159|nr:hypothetical protein [Arthrobacter sp. RIT-PI-e]KNC20446.1 hypothetical protein AC792_00550 [Arthrobacter sp. RIT-PI-e]
MSNAVHVWPIIVLTIGENEIVADANGDVLTYPVLEDTPPADVAADAASEACRRLGLTACRVQGHTEDGEVYEMIVDTEFGTLEERSTDPATTLTSGQGAVHGQTSARRNGRLRRRTSGVSRNGATAARNGVRRGPQARRRKLMIWGSAGAFALTLGVCGAYILQDEDVRPVATIYTPPPAQLPVPAPAGWDTYATWTAPMEFSTVRAILDPSGQPVSVDDTTLTAHDPGTGVERWTRTAPFTVSQVALFTLAGESRIAASTARELVLFGDGADPIRVQVPQNGTIVLDGGTAPRIDLPSKQTLLVTSNGSTVSRVVPAAAEPLEALGTDLVTANLSTGRIWRITTDSAALPSPATLPAPAPDAELISVLGSMDGRVVAAWRNSNRASDGVSIGFYDLGTATDATEVTQVEVVEVEGRDISASGLQLDREHGLMLAGSVLIDVPEGQAHRLPGAGKLSAGYAWVASGDEQVRINARGEAEDTTDASQASVPDVITEDGHAITRATGSPTGDSPNSLYALADTGPRPTSSPTTSPTSTPAPSTTPDPASTSAVSSKENP